MNWEEFLETFEDLEKYLSAIYEEFNSEIEIASNLIQVPVKHIDQKIKLHESQLDKLINGEEPDGIPSFKYLEDYGIKFKKYYEIAILISSDDYNWFEGDDWNTSPLKFKIGNTQFEVGLISPLMVLLYEPIHGESDFHYDFEEFASIKMVVETVTDYKEEFSKAIYYLNSHYLKPISFYAKLKRLSFSRDEDDPLGLFSGEDHEEIFKVAKRVRNRQRNNFLSVTPLCLYNEAFENKGTFRFLTFYRILEFFMEQAVIATAKTLRHDTNITEIELIRELSIRTEEDQLINLFKSVTTSSKRRKLIDYCSAKGLISERKFIQIPTQLYQYRNSLVHAKEKEINRTNIPNPFEDIPDNEVWTYIAEEVARVCIGKLNKSTSD